jgi:membrane associated rhomboid family serine protease
MDLVKSWAVAILVFVLGSALTVSVADAAKTTREELTSIGGAIFWNAGSALLIYFFMAALAAIVHSKPQRDDATRHILAVLGIPAVLVVLTLVFGLVNGTPPAGVVANVVGTVAGAFSGFALERWWRSRSRTTTSESTGDGYF